MENKVPLAAFFDAVERRLEHISRDGAASFAIKVCGSVIELRFVDKKHMECVRPQFRGQICHCDEPDAVFWYWADDRANYIGQEQLSAGWDIQDENGRLIFYNGSGFVGVNCAKKTFYRCRPSTVEPNPRVYIHFVNHAFYLWAKTKGRRLLHGAAVGADGKGVLLAGRGGMGKSSLAASCLLSGMDFVGDDLILLGFSGCPKASALYSNVGLLADMYARLGPDMPLIHWDEQRDKYWLDASDHIYNQELPIHALVLPKVVDASEPEIVPTNAGSVLTKLIHSTLQVIGLSRDTETVRTLCAWLHALPAYEFRQCGDLHKNAKFLREFIIKEL